MTKEFLCPMCKGPKVGTCRCGSSHHTMEDLKKGHGMKCTNGHNFTAEGLVYDPTKKDSDYKQLAQEKYINEVDALPRCLHCDDVISDAGGEGEGLCFDCFAKQQNDNADENNYHNREDNEESSRSGLAFTHSKPGEINEYGDTGTGMGQYSAGMSSNSVGTFSSPNVSQNPEAFASNHPSMYYPVGANKVDMYNNYRVTAPSDADIKILKKTVTPDEVIQGLSAILKSQFFKNKSKAKEILVQNLKRDPQYYSSLRYLGIEGPDKQLSETISYKDFYL